MVLYILTFTFLDSRREDKRLSPVPNWLLMERTWEIREWPKTEKVMQKVLKLSVPEMYSNEENLVLMQLF
jgi:hypothetical protein